ncbi:XdhC family protein [Mycobacterium sp. 21AC1]|uniref:XdhC family protein n=1 Tax=[Mycobacterium] appelbergii TaxID=2939269 RepID=UPI00293904DA|nr:XdhC/CoxI family protein [Mycobacterium sp. 21AC1]MDV3128385.1 XdhC family protein [Mycobacterium sp. 21AC1]
MRDILTELSNWQHSRTRFAVASIVRTWQSAPRGTGASMAVSETGAVVGSLSGGCVEGAVYAVAEEVLATGQPQLIRYGVSDDEAFETGLTCGGTLEVFVRPGPDPTSVDLNTLHTDHVHVAPTALVTCVSGDYAGTHFLLGPGGFSGSFGDRRVDDMVSAAAHALLNRAADGVVECGRNGAMCGDQVFLVQSFAPHPRMIVFGAIDFARAVTEIGKFLGYHVTICDARSTFTTAARFPDADEVVVSWPHRYLQQTSTDERTVICVLTHDEKFDIPVLRMALRLPVAYVGAMGSRRTHRKRLTALRECGLTETELEALHSPIGLDLGAHTPEETAVSVAAEIIAEARGGSGARLRRSRGAIHPAANWAQRATRPAVAPLVR